MPSEIRALTSLHIRPATVADRERLIPLINSAFAVETFMAGPRTDEERLAASMEKGVILVAEELVAEGLVAEDLVAVALVTKELEAKDSQAGGGIGRLLASIYTELRGARGYAGMLGVDPAHQRSGLGRRMMEAAEEDFRRNGCEGVDISVLSLRPELPPIYRKLGFVETGTEEVVYAHPVKDGLDCHCIVMSKKL